MFYGLLILFLYLPWFKGGKEIWAFSVFAVGVCILLLVRVLIAEKEKIVKLPQNKIFLPITVFLAWMVLDTIFSVYMYNSVWALARIMILLGYGLLFLSENDIERDKLCRLFLAALVVVCLGESVVVFSQKIRHLSPMGSFTNVNHVAGLLAVGASIVFAVILFSSRKIKYFGIAVIAVFVLAIFYTESRTGLLLLIISVGYLLFRKKSRAGLIALLSLIVVLFLLLPTNYWLKVTKSVTPDPYAHQRTKIWESGLKVVAEQPFFGVGADNFEYAYWKHNFPVLFDPAQGNISRYSKFTPFVHNEFLQIATDLGIPALVIFIWILYTLFLDKKNLSVSLFAKEGLRKIYAAESGLIVLLVQALFDFNLHLPFITLTFIVLAAIIISKSSEYKAITVPEKAGIWLKGLLLIIGLCLISNYVADRFAQNKQWQLAMAWNPLNADYGKQYGDSLAGKGDLKKAIKAYKYALFLNSHEPYYYSALGNCYFTNKQIYLAFKEYRQAVKLHPNNQFFHFQLGELFLSMQEYVRALSEYQQAVEIEPAYYMAYYRQIEVYKKMKNMGKVNQVLKQLFEMKQMINNVPPKNDYERRLLDFDWVLMKDM